MTTIYTAARWRQQLIDGMWARVNVVRARLYKTAKHPGATDCDMWRIGAQSGELADLADEVASLLATGVSVTGAYVTLGNWKTEHATDVAANHKRPMEKAKARGRWLAACELRRWLAERMRTKSLKAAMQAEVMQCEQE